MSYQDWPLAETCRLASRMMDELHSATLVVLAKHKGEQAQADLAYRVTHKHHQEFFLTNLEPLGIDVHRDPPAVVCAKYHYLSNAIGGLDMEYVEESSEKAWVRYWPWHPSYYPIYFSTEMAGLRAWHAYNGLSLYSVGLEEGLHIGVVCTKLSSLGDPVMELYFLDYGRELEQEERCVFLPEAQPPDSTHYGDAWKGMLAKHGVRWPEERLAKGRRNYSRFWAADIMRELISTYGTEFACGLIAETCRLMAVQNARQWKEKLGIPEEGAKGLALFLKAIGDIQGEEMEVFQESAKRFILRQRSSRLFSPLNVPGQVFQALNAFNQASAQMFRHPITGPRVEVELVKSIAQGHDSFEWLIAER